MDELVQIAEKLDKAIKDKSRKDRLKIINKFLYDAYVMRSGKKYERIDEKYPLKKIKE